MVATHLYSARIEWTREGATFTDQRYSRAHYWKFDGGVTTPASSSPHSVPLPFSDASAVDPEEALVAAAASCHMLSFLPFAARAGYVVDHYEDEAEGTLGPDAGGRIAITKIQLRPQVTFAGSLPSQQEHIEWHEQAHNACYIANTLRCPVECEPFALLGVTS